MAITKMNFREMMTNPPGKSSRQVAARYTIIGALTSFYRAAINDPARRERFKLSVFAGRPAGVFLAWVKVPSAENQADMDVVFELDYESPKTRSTSMAQVRLYCNSPGWVFTYGYVANKNGLLATGFDVALGKAVTSVRPRTTNPPEDFGFDKVVYQAALFLVGKGGIFSRQDAERASAVSSAMKLTPPDPGDARLGAEAMLKSYQAAEIKTALGKRQERSAARTTAAKEDLEAANTARKDAARHGTSHASRKSATKTVPAGRAATRATKSASVPAAGSQVKKPKRPAR